MVLYCLFAVPLFALFVASSKMSGEADRRRLWTQYFRGVLVFVPSYIILLLIRGAVPLNYTYGSIFAHYFVYEALFYAVLASIAYILIRLFSKANEHGSVSEAFVFFSGFFTFASVIAVIRSFPYFDAYNLFLNPTIKLAIVAALAFVLARSFESVGIARWIYLLVGLAFVVATAIVPFLFFIHFAYIAVIIAVVLFLAALFPYVLLRL